MSDLYSNFAFCRVTSNVLSTDTTINVDDVSSLPTTAQASAADFYMTFDSALTHPSTFEVVKVTAVGTSTITVVRAQEGTSAQAHSQGTIMRGALTAGMLARLAAGYNGSYVPTLNKPQGTLQRRYTFDSSIQSWTTDHGSLAQTSGLLQFTPGTSQDSTALEPSTAANVADGEVYLDFVPVSVTGNIDYAGIVFRATDANNYYMFELQTFTSQAGASEFSLIKRVSGTYTTINPQTMSRAQSDTPFALPKLHGIVRLMVRFVGSQLSLYVNETFVGSWIDSTYTTGRVGVYCYGNPAVVNIDNVSVYALSSAWTPANYDQPSSAGLQAWQTPTLTNSWANYNTAHNGGVQTYNNAGYYLGPDGIVHLRGLISDGTAGQPCFTLPVGYRPDRINLMPAVYNPGAGLGVTRVDVASDGTVTPQVTTTYLSLDGISFRQFG